MFSSFVHLFEYILLTWQYTTLYRHTF